MKDNTQQNSTVKNGEVIRIIFQNPDNDYTVLMLKDEDGRDTFTAVGYLGGVQPADEIQLTGEWVEDRRFGEQFKVSRFQIIPPKTEKGIINFLSSDMIKGIGKGYATKIVKTFGLDTLRIISEEPEKLSQVKGLGQKRVDRLLKSWRDNYAVRDIMMFLQSYEISAAFASRIFKEYKYAAIDIVKENPYRLARDIHGIGFISADNIAKSMGIESDAAIRIESGLMYLLSKTQDNGHTFYPENSLLKETAAMLKVDEELVSKSLDHIISNSQLIRKDIEHNSVIYHPRLLEAEEGVAYELKRLQTKPLVLFDNTEEKIETVEKKSEILFSEAQKKSLKLGIEEKVLVITGGPGTGKTTIMKSLVELYEEAGLNILLAAPTGRAARRLSESSGKEAKTIHRLLEFNPKFNDFSKDESDPLETDAVIIDEASMIDILLAYSLIKAIPSHARLILVGDADQLPSVGPGKVLNDILSSEEIPFVCLDNIFRQAEGSDIIINAHKINKGERLSYSNTPDSNFFFIQKDNNEDIPTVIEKLVKERIPAHFKLDSLKSVQILTPMHKTLLGVQNLNSMLKNILNPDNSTPVRRHLNISPGDKVMQTSNNYDKDIFNGDIGFVKAIDKENQVVWINFDGRLVEYPFNEADDLILAYAITIHKSQGSEYDAVIIPVTTQHYTMLQRNLLYTAVTRGKKLVVLIGSKKALQIAISTQRENQRFTNLINLLHSS